MPVRLVEGQKPYTGGTGIEIDTDKVISLLLREENNLIMVNDDNEIYTDLQLASGLTPSSDFPVGVTVGKVLEADGWTQSGLLLNRKTTSGDYARWIYGADGNIYFDGGTGVWNQVYYSSQVDALLQALQNYIDQNYQPKLTAGAGIVIDQNNVISAQGAGTGDVSGPSSSVDGHLAVFDGTTGKAIKDGGVVPTPTPVIDNLTSTSTTSALSANQGRVLEQKIEDLMGMGKFLSLWNCATGQPISFPLSTPYAYTTGDYFIVSVVSTANPPVNYKPNGSSYTGTASTTTTSDEVEEGDFYVYDGNVWLFASNHGKTVTFANIAGQPSDNTNLATALNAKQDTLTAGTNISIQNNTISATDTTYSAGTGLSLTGTTFANTGVTSVNGDTGTVTVSEFNPDSAGTTGDVLTKTADGYEWAEPAEGDVIEYVTQAEYTALLPGAASDGKHYFIYTAGVAVTGVTLDESEISLTTVGDTYQLTATVSPNDATDKSVTWSSSDNTVATVSNTGLVTCVTPGTCTITVTTTDGGFTATCDVVNTWQPGVNTLAYMPFSGNYDDTQGNTVTESGTAGTYATTQQGEQYMVTAGGPSSNNTLLTISSLNGLTGNGNWTVSCWVNPTDNGNLKVIRGYGMSISTGGTGLILTGSNEIIIFVYAGDIYTGVTITPEVWNNIVFTHSSGTNKVYVNGSLVDTRSTDFTFYNSRLSILSDPNNGSNGMNGGFDDMIIEDKTRTAQEVLDYYDQTKGNYEQQPRTPGVNTIAYYTFKNTLVGEVGGTATLGSGSSIGADYATTNASIITCPLSETLNPTSDSFTFSIWCNTYQQVANQKNPRLLEDYNVTNIFPIYLTRAGLKVLINRGADEFANYTGALNGLNTWNNIIVTYSGSGSTYYIYVNGVKYTYPNGLGFNNALDYAIFGGTNPAGDYGYWYLSRFIVEKGKQRTDQECVDYYNQTKGDYGIS